MAALCDDANAETEKGKALYNWCHGETKRRLEFPNFFITVSPSEWNFPIPAPLWNWIQANPSRISEVTGPLTLHIYNVLHTAMKADLLQRRDDNDYKQGIQHATKAKKKPTERNPQAPATPTPHPHRLRTPNNRQQNKKKYPRRARHLPPKSRADKQNA